MMRALILAVMLIIGFAENPFNEAKENDNYFGVNENIVEEIKTSGLWTPIEISENVFKGWTFKQLKDLCGLLPSDKPVSTEFMQNDDENETLLSLQALPTSFDGRTAWSKCITPVKDQGKCGSCWAFASGDTLGDTRCIKKKVTSMVQLSQQDQVSCDIYDYGCKGGYLYNSFYYLSVKGVVKASCLPYTSGNGVVPACPSKCASTSESWVKYKCNGGFYYYRNSISGMKNWLTTNGPMTVGMSVYQDFFSYKSGIYTRVSSSYAGGHAIKLVGYGVSGTTKYWICQNSWGTSWGMKGFFYIKEGQCGIESEALACLPYN